VCVFVYCIKSIFIISKFKFHVLSSRRNSYFFWHQQSCGGLTGSTQLLPSAEQARAFLFFFSFSVQIISQLSASQVFYYFYLSFFRFFFMYHVVLPQVIAFCAAVLSFFLLCFGFAGFGWF
jgi:hypothetical protein